MENNNENIYDVIIIGSGPAGITAGIYAVRREMKALVIGKDVGGQVVWASEVDNYPGLPRIGNIELIEKWHEHAKGLGVQFKLDEIKEIRKEGEYFNLFTNKETYTTRTVIIAMGLVPRRLAIPGEEKLTGKGVSYCANCDSPFYRNQDVAVVGGGNSALDAAEILSKIAKQVYLVHRRDEFRGFDALLSEVKSKPNVKIYTPCEISEIQGEERVTGLKLKDTKNGECSEVKLNGVFIEIGRIAHSDLVAEFVDRTKKGQIIVDDKCRTKTPGLYAAGDITTTPYKQITIAMGQATIAALAAYEYIQMKEGKDITGPVFDRGPKKLD